jgi:hypothetical protein
MEMSFQRKHGRSGVGPVMPYFVFSPKKTKADVAKHQTVFRHVGLLFNQPSGKAGLFFG